MSIVGLDFSINFPGICVSSDDFSNFYFQSIASSSYVSGVYEDFIHESEEKYGGFRVGILDNEAYRQTFKTDVTYSESERLKLDHFNDLALSITSSLKVKPALDVSAFAMEGIAYGAKGSSLVDIAIATGVVRTMVLSNMLKGDSDKMFIFSPSEMKNAIGCKGNADKWDVFDAFIGDPKIQCVRDSGLYRFLSENRDHPYVRKPATAKAKHEVKSPWSDMIDAYLAVLKMYNSLNGIEYEKPAKPRKEKKAKPQKTA